MEDLIQMSLFDFTREPIRITKPIRLIELFACYGSQAMALNRIGASLNITELWSLISTLLQATTQYMAQILQQWI